MVPIGELLTTGFVARHTRFRDLEQWLAAAGLDSMMLAHLTLPGLDTWDGFVRKTTRFPDWSSMLREAGAEWVVRRLGIVIDA